MYILDENVSAKEYIIQAFIKLLESKAFEEISVKEIVKKAGISRSTFYIHFQDKYKLMDFIRETITSKFLAFYENEPTEEITTSTLRKVTTLEICQHIYEYRYFYQHEFKNPVYVQYLSNALAEKLGMVYGDASYGIFASYGSIGYLAHWVRGKFSISPEAAAEELEKISVTDWSVLSY
jgi:AcrR family transcriptional regulator